MDQRSFTDYEYDQKEKKTKREIFLERMEKILPWSEWETMIAPYYPTGGRGRPVRGIRTMLKMYLLQIWFNLSDVGVEETAGDSLAMRRFLGLDLARENIPDATTLLKFRHLLEKNNIGEKIFEHIKCKLQKEGLIMKGGAIIDATIIEAPKSTKNKNHERDQEMSSTKKGNNWHFGMKVHSKVDVATGYVTKIVGTTGKESDISVAHKLLTSEDKVVYGDSGYVGIEKRDDIKSCNFDTEFRIVSRPKRLKEQYKNYNGYNWERAIERRKSEIRCFVEHPFLYVKRRYSKLAYKGLKKNMQRLYMLFACANIAMCVQAKKEYALA